MAAAVLDASALLALLNAEPGAERVSEALMRGAVMSAVNYAEVFSKLRESSIALDDVHDILATIHVDVMVFDMAQAVRVGDVRPETKALGLSLGDRACLALGALLTLPVLTADRSWESTKIGVSVLMVR